jgi:hypothetical protein
MFYLILAFLVLFIGSGLFTFDEEGLIILCSFLWVDAAGGLFRTALDSELISKVAVIRSKFSWYIISKREFVLDLLKIHNGRTALVQFVAFLNNWLMVSTVKNVLALTLVNLSSRRLYESQIWVLNFGVAVHHAKLIKVLESSLSVAPFSFTLIRVPSSKVLPLFHTYKSLFVFSA